MAGLKFDVAKEEAVKNPKFREVFKAFGGGFDFNKPSTLDALKSRPFVSPLAWAYFSVYASIVAHAVIRMKGLEVGADIDFANTEQVTKLVKVALPHQEA